MPFFPRSPLLRPFPRPSLPSRARMLTRGALMLSLGLLLYWLVAELRAERLPKSGFFFLLYKAHDQVYLWLKGWFYTWLHPWSLIALLPAFFATLYFLSCFVACRPLSRRIHAWLVSRALDVAALHPLMVETASWLAVFGVKPGMMTAVADRRRRQLLNKLHSLPGDRAPGKVCVELLRLTRFLIQLKRLNPPDAQADIEPLECWRQAFTPLRWRREALPDTKAWRKRWRAFVQMGSDLALAKLGFPSLTALFQSQSAEPAPFSRPALGLDLLILAFEGTDLESELFEIAGCQSAATVLRRRLVQNTSRRRETLEMLRRRHDVLSPTPLAKGPSDADAAVLPGAGSPAEMRFWSALALFFAIEASRLAKDNAIAMGYLDSLEALRLTCAMAGEDEPAWLPIATHVPAPEDFRMLAEATRRDQEQRAHELNRNGFFKEGILHLNDMNWGWQTVEELNLAAGHSQNEALPGGFKKHGR